MNTVEPPAFHPRRLVLVGSILVDILLYIDVLPQQGADCFARRSLLTTGGGLNVLAAAVRLGLLAAYGGLIGDGVMGNQVLADLTAAGIPVLLPRIKDRDSGFDVGLVEASDERRYVTSPGVEAELLPEHVQALLLLPGDAIYVSGYDLCYPISGQTLGRWLPALSTDLLLVVDPGPLVAEIPEDRLAEVLRRVDMMSLNTRELHLLTGEQEIQAGIHQLSRRLSPRSWIVVRAGEHGCWIGNAMHTVRQIPARPARVVDTTGAGDAHVAALLAHLARGDDLWTAAYKANVAASLSVEKRGPATGPTLTELQEILHTM